MNSVTLSPGVRKILGRTSKDATPLSLDTSFLLALNAKAAHTGAPVFAGIPVGERARRRKAGKRQRAARRATRRGAA